MSIKIELAKYEKAQKKAIISLKELAIKLKLIRENEGDFKTLEELNLAYKEIKE